MTPAQAAIEIKALKAIFVLLPEAASTFGEWERLISTYRVSGKNTHDAHLVATMKMHRVNKILTFNVADFARFSEIEAIDPATFQM